MTAITMIRSQRSEIRGQMPDTKQARLRQTTTKTAPVFFDYAAVAALTCLSSMREIACSDVAPTTRSSSRPFLNRIRVGMPLMPYLCETEGLSSTFSLTTRALLAYFSATASTVGASMRHGAHHAAQKSTKTGRSDFSTSFSKVPSLVSLTCSLMNYSLDQKVFDSCS